VNPTIFDLIKDSPTITIPNKKTNPEELQKFYNQVCKKLNVPFEWADEIVPAPTEQVDSPSFFQSGILFNQYISSKNPYIKTAPLAAIFKNQPSKHRIHLLPIELSQVAFHKYVGSHKVNILDAPKGHGKTYALYNFMINAASKGKRCLYLSPDLNKCRAFLQFFRAKELGKLCFAFSGEEVDKKYLASNIISGVSNKKIQKDFEKQIDQFQQIEKIVAEQQAPFRVIIYEDNTLSESVGSYLNTTGFSKQYPIKERMIQNLKKSDIQPQLYDLKDKQELVKLYEQIQTELIEQIQNLWSHSHTSFDAKDMELPLKKFLTKNKEIISHHFPFLSMTVATAAKLFDGWQTSFDWIIFDDAHSVNGFTAKALFPLAKKVIISGDLNLATAASSLLKTVQSPTVKTYNFDKNYYQQPVEIVAFLNPSEGHQLIENSSNKFAFYKSQNPSQKLLELIGNTRRNRSFKMPSISIATVSRAEAIQVNQLLNKEKQKNGRIGEKIHQLEQNGLEIYALEDGHFSSAKETILWIDKLHPSVFDTISDKWVLAFVSNLISPFTIISNVENEYTTSPLSTEGANLFSQFVQYIQSIANGSVAASNEILQSIDTNNLIQKESFSSEESLFYKALYEGLEPYFKKNTLLKNIYIGKVRFPIVIKDNKQYIRPVVISVDGSFLPTHKSSFWLEIPFWKTIEKYQLQHQKIIQTTHMTTIIHTRSIEMMYIVMLNLTRQKQLI